MQNFQLTLASNGIMISVKNPWKILSSKTAYKNKYYRVREDNVIRPDRKKGKYFVIEIPPSVTIIPLTKYNEIYLVGVFRYTFNSFSWEAPSGSCDGQNVIDSAKRELKEETGLTATKWKILKPYKSLGGFVDKTFYTVLARNLHKSSSHKQKEEGILKMKTVPFKESLKMIKNGEIVDGETITSISIAGLSLGFI